MLQAISAIFLAAILWFIIFYEGIEFTSIIHNKYFWEAISLASFNLVSITLITQKKILKQLFSIKQIYIIIGIISGIILYIVSWVGVIAIKYFMPEIMSYLIDIYTIKYQINSIILLTVLIMWVAIAEEIFWRGMIQNILVGKYGIKAGLIISSILYSLVHVWTFNPLLLFTALIFGIIWGYIYYKYDSLIPSITSHVVWDIMIIIIIPFY